MPYPKEQAGQKAAERQAAHAEVHRSHVVAGLQDEAPWRTASRREICLPCEHNTSPGNVLALCTQCGCLIMAKTRMTSSRCPIGKW